MENTLHALEDGELDQVTGGLSDAAKTGLVLMGVGFLLGPAGMALNTYGTGMYLAHKND
jgi:hypothetical protein